jgi:hypothetical protein
VPFRSAKLGSGITTDETGMGLQVDDVVIAQYYDELGSGATTMTPATGFNQIFLTTVLLGTVRATLGLFWTRRTGSAIATNWSVTGGGASGNCISLSAYSGIKTSGSPINVQSSAVVSGQDSTAEFDSLTTTVNGCILVGALSHTQFQSVVPGDWDNERYDGATTQGTTLFDETKNNAGASNPNVVTVGAQTWLTAVIALEPASPPASKPQVEGVSESTVATAGTSHLVTLPANIAASDMVLITMDIGSTSATINSLTDWQEILDENVANGLKIFRYTGAGVPSNPTFTSSAATRSASVAWRISGADESVTPQIGTTATGTSTTPNPPSVTPSAGAKDYLFIAFFGMAGEEADDDTWVNSPPTNYLPSLPYQKAAGTAGTNLGGLIGAAYRELNTASAEDPGTFSVDVSAAWRAQTIIIHPATSGGITVDGTVGTGLWTGVAGTVVMGSTTVNGTVGSALWSGVAGTVVLAGKTVNGTIGSALWTGVAGTVVMGGTVVNGTIGSALWSGVAGDVEVGAPIVVNGTIGTGLWSGVAGTVVLAGAVVNGAAAAVGQWSGVAGTVVLAGKTVNGTIGSALWSGTTGSVVLAQKVVNGTIGTALWSGTTGTVALAGAVVNGTVGVGLWSGVTGTVGNVGIVINGTIGLANWTGIAGTVSIPIVINGTVGVGQWSGTTGSIVLGQKIVNGSAPAVGLWQGIAGSVGSAAIVVNGTLGTATWIGVTGTVVKGSLAVVGSTGLGVWSGVSGTVLVPVVLLGSIGQMVFYGVSGDIGDLEIFKFPPHVTGVGRGLIIGQSEEVIVGGSFLEAIDGYHTPTG